MVMTLSSHARIFDAVVGNLAKNFAEGTEYFKVSSTKYIIHTSLKRINIVHEVARINPSTFLARNVSLSSTIIDLYPL